MNDGIKKRNRQLAFEVQNSHVCEKRSKLGLRKLHFSKSDEDEVYIWPQNRL